MSDGKNNVFLNNLAELSSLDNIQKYILGTKSNGQPRAVYDIIKDYSHHGGKKHDHHEPNTYSIYLKAKRDRKKKKHKGGHKKKYWHI